MVTKFFLENSERILNNIIRNFDAVAGRTISAHEIIWVNVKRIGLPFSLCCLMFQTLSNVMQQKIVLEYIVNKSV